MCDVRRFTGIDQFGPRYRVMLENDPNAPGSVDRVLIEQMVRLCPETVQWLYDDYTPADVCYEPRSRPELENHLQRAVAGRDDDEAKITSITEFCHRLQDRATDELEEMLFGGTEEEIIRRGSDWCTEVARVGCVLSQLAGLPARMVYLFDTGAAYSGHAMTEVYRGGVWGAVCPHTAVIYRHPDGIPASVWDLMGDPALIDAHRREEGTTYTRAGQFRGAAISNYPLHEWRRYEYPVSPINHYYRAILAMSLQGWPGGLRWIHGEDGSPPFAPCGVSG
jgi:hypothetical protein